MSVYPIHIHIIGDLAECSPLLNHMACQSVIPVCIEGKRSDIQQCYREIDIFVLPSLYEGFPNVLIEAMLAGCLCIVNASVNSSDLLIEHGISGFVYNGSDADLSNQIIHALDYLKTDKSKAIRKAACERAEQFSMDRMIVRWQQVILG